MTAGSIEHTVYTRPRKDFLTLETRLHPPIKGCAVISTESIDMKDTVLVTLKAETPPPQRAVGEPLRLSINPMLTDLGIMLQASCTLALITIVAKHVWLGPEEDWPEYLDKG